MPIAIVATHTPNNYLILSPLNYSRLRRFRYYFFGQSLKEQCFANRRSQTQDKGIKVISNNNYKLVIIFKLSEKSPQTLQKTTIFNKTFF